jgi:hypothetical protein
LANQVKDLAIFERMIRPPNPAFRHTLGRSHELILSEVHVCGSLK